MDCVYPKNKTLLRKNPRKYSIFESDFDSSPEVSLGPKSQVGGDLKRKSSTTRGEKEGI